MDALLPKYRNADLTLAQFAENYNDYAKLNGMVSYLSEKGEWYTPNTSDAILIDVFDVDENWQFIIDNNKNLEQIKISMNSDSKLFFFGDGQISLVIYTAIMSQPDVDIVAAEDAMNKLSEVTFVKDLKETRYDFNGVIVELEIQKTEYNIETPAKMLIDISLP